MPAKSQAQFRLLQGIAHGSIAPKGGLTPEKAAEYVSGQSPKGLPERKSGRSVQRKRQARKAKKGY
jgi:hypothetical protein